MPRFLSVRYSTLAFALTLVIFVLLRYDIRPPGGRADVGSGLGMNDLDGHRKGITERSAEPRIAILTFVTDERSYTQLSLKNKDAYARHQNYDLIVDFAATDPAGLMWHKLVMLERTITRGNYDWIWWIDFDTLITNMEIKLEDIISEALDGHDDPNGVDLLLTADCFELNAGSMIVRSHPRSLAFFARVRDYYHAHQSSEEHLSEQDCIRNMLRANEYGESQEVVFVPQWKTNAFPKEIACYDKDQRAWESGMLLVHFAGAWAHVKEPDPTGYLMRKYEPYILWP